MLCPVDSSMTSLTEAVLLGSGDAKLAEMSINEETRTLLELALGSSAGLAGGLWRKMEDYAHSKGTRIGFHNHISLYERCIMSVIHLSLRFHVTIFIINKCCCTVRSEWESGGSLGNCLLDTVCRCSLAALLKHTGLQNEACWKDRSVIITEVAPM